MNTKYDMSETAQAIVYVKPVATADLPAEVREQAGDVETLYAVHNEMGEQLALVADRTMAFALARQNDMAPVTVH
ncbi:DUF1150 family protein [Roseobacteraceae bacterium S113]